MDSEKLKPTLNQAINWIIEIHRLGRFLPICGNGCLAADARDNPLGVDRNVSQGAQGFEYDLSEY